MQRKAGTLTQGSEITRYVCSGPTVCTKREREIFRRARPSFVKLTNQTNNSFLRTGGRMGRRCSKWTKRATEDVSPSPRNGTTKQETSVTPPSHTYTRQNRWKNLYILIHSGNYNDGGEIHTSIDINSPKSGTTAIKFWEKNYNTKPSSNRNCITRYIIRTIERHCQEHIIQESITNIIFLKNYSRLFSREQSKPLKNISHIILDIIIIKILDHSVACIFHLCPSNLMQMS